MWKKIEKGIYQEGKYSFRVRIMLSGTKLDRTCDSLAEARTLRDLHKAAAALDPNENSILLARAKKRESKSFTLADAIKDYRKEKSEHKKGWESEGNRLDRIERLPIAKKPLYTINKDALLTFFNDIRSGEGQQIKGVAQRTCSESTVKRYYNLLRHVFEIARTEWKKIDKNPFDDLAKTERPKDGKPRDRRFEGDEYKLMKEQLTGEARVALIVFIESAMRKGDLLSLEWQNVRFKAGTAFLPDGKGGEPRSVPLSDEAMDALKTLPRGIKGKVFTIGKDALRYQWRKAREAIGSPDLRIHDLRHEGTSILAEEKGFNIFELQAVTGHKTITMLKRYVNLKPDAIRAKMNKRS